MRFWWVGGADPALGDTPDLHRCWLPAGDAGKGAERGRQNASGSSPAPSAAAECELVQRSGDVRCDGGEGARHIELNRKE